MKKTILPEKEDLKHKKLLDKENNETDKSIKNNFAFELLLVLVKIYNFLKRNRMKLLKTIPVEILMKNLADEELKKIKTHIRVIHHQVISTKDGDHP